MEATESIPDYSIKCGSLTQIYLFERHLIFEKQEIKIHFFLLVIC